MPLTVIDYLALALTHALILLALIRAAGRDELDSEPEFDAKRPNPGSRSDQDHSDA